MFTITADFKPLLDKLEVVNPNFETVEISRLFDGRSVGTCAGAHLRSFDGFKNIISD